MSEGARLHDGNSRWRAFLVLCVGALMIVMDASIVNVALPIIKADLGFSQAALVWVVNAYLLTFGGFLLLGGRLGDLFGRRRLLLLGIAVFTTASVACGVANSRALLVGARAIQGLGGAVVTAIVVSLITTLFEDVPERAKAMGVYGFVISCGGIIGVLLGGTLTGMVDWHWIFLINIPLGAAVFALCLLTLPVDSSLLNAVVPLDIAGAATVTTALTVAVYAIVNADGTGWFSVPTVTLFLGAVSLLILFRRIEARVPHPLVPLELLRRPKALAANLIFVLWVFATSAWYFISGLYLQTVLGYRPEQVGLAFLPTSVLAAIFSLGISAKLVLSFGIKWAMIVGLLPALGSFVLLARAPIHGTMAADVFPAMCLMGLGSGIAPNSMMLAAMRDTGRFDSGLISGVLNTSLVMSCALGLAVHASVASRHTNALLASGTSVLIAANGGYHLAFLVGAVTLVFASLISITFLRTEQGMVTKESSGHFGQKILPPPVDPN